MSYSGAKLALYIGDKLAVILRDDRPDLIFADHWDLPGGGREGEEPPLDCALRECREELGIDVPPEAVVWERAFLENDQIKWFFVACLPATFADDIVLGDEGQRWQLMSEDAFLSHPKAVPAFQERLAVYLADRGTGG